MNDVSGRTERAAKPSGKTRLPPLSPGFLKEEDAAFWAHTRIPLKPDREYGSVILRRPDGRYVATSPIPGQVTRFDFGTLIEVDASGNYVHPSGYRCVANVHCHAPLHDHVRAANPRWDELLIRLFISFFSDLDFVADVAARNFFPSAYLSGPDGTLLKYSPSGSPEEFSYYLWRKAGSPSGNPVGTYDVMSIINKVAAVGELKVIVSNADWGHSVGVVPADWKAGQPFSRGVVSEQPLMARLAPNAERAVLAALKSRGAQSSGLLLKKRGAEQYVATHARPAGLSAWDAQKTFPAGPGGKLELPTGYALEGFYYASWPDPARTSPSQPWLYENFFTPQEMALAIASHGRARHLAASDSPLSLYVQTRDAAMLKYTFSGDPIEAALSIDHPDGSVTDPGLQSRLLTGTLRPREFVSMLVISGRLDVLRGSALWARLGRVDLQWQPFANFPWPGLSDGFLSAEDAVRYAHEQVGNRRDRAFVGYVFQRSVDDRFVVTEPIEGDIAVLGSGRLYPRDIHGQTIFPEDHALRGRYVSHVALSQLERVVIEDFKWTHEEAVLSLQMPSVEEIRQTWLDKTALYVSGAANSLLRYELSEGGNARELAARLGSRENPGALALKLAGGELRPQDFVRLQAAGGRLTVLLDNPLWGHRGDVPPDWAMMAVPLTGQFGTTTPESALPDQLPAPPALFPNRPLDKSPIFSRGEFLSTSPFAWKRPDSVACGAVFPTADEAAQNQAARAAQLQDEPRALFGFILKHREREEYVATEVVPVNARGDNLFQLQALFGSQLSEPWYQYPDGFSLYANFYLHHDVKRPSSDTDAWLAQHFISPDNLTVAMYYSPRRPVRPSGLPVALYVSTQDGALLKYVRNSASKLFHDDLSSRRLETIKQDLASGKWKPADFIHEVADSGELSVMRRSLCWDRVGRVDGAWKPYANLERRRLGPLFQNADDAAVHARLQVPRVADAVYGGVILKTPEGLFVATVPIKVSRENFDLTEVFPDESYSAGLFPAGCSIAARYRSRAMRELSVMFTGADKQLYLNMLSVDTVYSAFIRTTPKRWDEYLFGPDGSLIRYQAGAWEHFLADLSRALTGTGHVPPSLDAVTIRERIRSGDLKPGQWVDSLARAGYLYVVIGSEIWGAPRQVTRWVPYAGNLLPMADYHKATRAAACSPVFIQTDAAATYVHEAVVSRDTLTFGFILRCGDGAFIASLPIEAQRSRLALDRVFEQGRLPYGHVLDAIYLRAPLPPLGAGHNDVRSVFLSPTDVLQACRRANMTQGYLPIYFSCADGALLRLKLHPFEPGEFYDRHGQIELRPNTFDSPAQAANDERDIAKGTFVLADFVRRMARAGRLDVLKTSEYWSHQGWNREDKETVEGETADDERWRTHPEPALGPLFHHVDDAARHAGSRAGEPVLDRGYEAAILAHGTSPRFVPLEPVAVSSYESKPLARIFRAPTDPSISWRNPAPRYPEGYTLVASHQMHLSGNTTLGTDAQHVQANFASPAQVLARTHQLKDQGFAIQAFYYSTPYGVLLKYVPVYTPAERDLLSTRLVAYENGRWVTRLSPGEFISRLGALGELSVLVAGHYWRQTGRQGGSWSSSRQQMPSPGFARRRDEL
ncbi:hypothetical protein ABIA54_001697 [Pseudomonas sp. EB276 TE3739]|uniref:DUF4329 domain-containing protein n=1 Tax=Pseudomonas TaxID=286 RepID=UPI0020A1A343|nr:DUF4329 domain-containing protein [Pseudomonas koreensis]MCP1474216.1 hypothetical protein [Pseudomonas koreensis]